MDIKAVQVLSVVISGGAVGGIAGGADYDTYSHSQTQRMGIILAIVLAIIYRDFYPSVPVLRRAPGVLRLRLSFARARLGV